MRAGDSSWISEAQAQAAANGFTNGSSNVAVTVKSPPTFGAYSGDPLAVQATVAQTNIANVFMSLVNGGTSTVAAVSVAREIPTCIWIMNQVGSTSNASLALASAGMYPSCGVYVNTQPPGLNLGADAFATLGSLRNRVVGGAAQNSSTGNVYPSPRYTSATKLDPLAYVTAPVLSSCTYNATSLSSITTTVGPATFCGGTSLSNSNITLAAGVYIIADGLTLNNTTLTGTGVTMYFTKSSGHSTYANISIQNSNISLKAPTNSSGGGIPGVVFFADRNWVAHGSWGFSFNNTPINIDGYWYSLNTGVYLWSSPITYSSYNGLITDNIYQYGASSHWGNNNFVALGGVFATALRRWRSGSMTACYQ